MAKMEHFEIPTDDIVRAQEFYREVLGYEYEPWGDDMGMLMQPEGEGVNGDLHLRGASPHPTVVFTVDDLEATVQSVLANGGSTVNEIQAMGDDARWVYVKDSESNVIGLYETTA